MHGCLESSVTPARLSRLMRAQEAEEFHALSQAALHHLPAAKHLPNDLPDLSRTEVETLVEQFYALEDLFLRQMRVADRRQLDTVVIDQVHGIILLQPAILHGLSVQGGPRIGRGQ